MKLHLPIAATAAATAPLVNGYGLAPYGLGRPMLVSPGRCAPGAVALLRDQQALMNQVFRSSPASPRYDITDNEETFQVAIDVPGVKASDIDVSVEDDGKVLKLSGHREFVKEGSSYSSRFSQSFTLDPSVDFDKFTANLKNGVLVVSAPKDWKRIEESIRTIPVTELEEETIPVTKAQETETVHDEETKPVDAEVESKDQDGTTDDVSDKNADETGKQESTESNEA